MIQEKSYGLRVEFDGDFVHIWDTHYIVICGGNILRDQAAEDCLWRDVNFIAHHGFMEICIIAFGYHSHDAARQGVIEALFNMPKIIDCATISDAQTPQEGEVWTTDIPF